MVSNHPTNLVSIHAAQQKVSGPGKVFWNLVKGLNRIGQPYVINQALDSTRQLWIHSDLCALLELPKTGTLTLLGPNLAILPRDLPTRRIFRNSIYLQPSQWVVRLWEQEGFTQCPLRAWPVGIDTEELPRRHGRSCRAPVLVYFKQRFPEELIQLEAILRQLDLNHNVITYGNYDQNDFVRMLQECSFVIWIGRQESQGIALQETLAMDVPVLVLDALSVFEHFPPPTGLFPERLRSFRTTSAPYFDARCGMVIESLDAIEEAVDLMQDNLDDFQPREFVLENLSLEKQARQFVTFFETLSGMYDHEAARLTSETNRLYRPALLTRLQLKSYYILRDIVSKVRRSRSISLE